MCHIVDPVSGETPPVLLLADDPRARELSESLAGRAVVRGEGDVGADKPAGDSISTAAAAIVLDADGIDRVRELEWKGPIVAFVDDPTDPPGDPTRSSTLSR